MPLNFYLQTLHNQLYRIVQHQAEAMEVLFTLNVKNGWFEFWKVLNCAQKNSEKVYRSTMAERYLLVIKYNNDIA